MQQQSQIFKGDNMNRTMKKSLKTAGMAAAFSLVGATAFAGILKTPYLIYSMPNTTMTVLWQDNATETTNKISWGTDTTYSMGSAYVPEESNTTPGRGGVVNQHNFTITGLQPNTTYYYQVADDTNGVYGTGSFITAPAESATSVRFIGQGDSRGNPFVLNDVMKAIIGFYSLPGNSDYQRLSIHNGDWVASDAESNWTTEWFDLTKLASRAFTASTPIDGVKGNHDNSSGYSTTFAKYFPFPYPNETLQSGKTATYNNLYWSLDYGPVHITYIDVYSPLTPGSAQYTWVQSDLAATTKPWKIVVFHEGTYTAGSDADSTAMRIYEAAATPIFQQNNVDFLYGGHSHNYARAGAYNAAQAGTDPIALNIPHMTSGGGGAPIYQPDMTNANSYPHVITAWPSNEFMAFDVEGNTLTMTAYQVTGQTSTTTDYPLSTTFPANDGISGHLYLEPIETTVLHHFTANVTPQVTATTSPLIYNRATKLYSGTLTVTNNGTTDINGAVDVVLDGMLDLNNIGTPSNMYATTSKITQNAGVNSIQTSMIANNPATGKTSTAGSGLLTNARLTNATGSQNGEPMIRATSAGIPAGTSVTVTLNFSNPTNAKINFNPIVFQE
jgi:hypothetical protein